MQITHISDLHVSGNYFVPEWGDKIINKINSINPDILIISGDLTDDGHLFEYEKASEFIRRFEVENRIVVPGNHDARNDGFKLFEEFFGDRFSTYEDENVFILAMDSSSPDTDEGHIGRENYHLIKNMKNRRDKIKIIVLHHHVIPIPHTGREQNILVDAGDVLGHIVDSGVHLVLSGHRHLPWSWKLENTFFVTTGTATSWRLKGRSFPSFNLIELNDTLINIKQVNILKDSIEEENRLLIN